MKIVERLLSVTGLRRRTVASANAANEAAARIVVTAGTVLEHEYPLLRHLVEESNSRPGPIIEIGTLFGFTTSRIAVALAPGKRIITVDNYSWNPWHLSSEQHYAMTANVLHYLRAVGKVEQVRCDKDEFYREYRDEPPALVFLDAIHTYSETKADIEWARKMKAAIITGHDYSDEFPGIKKAVEEFGGPVSLCGTVWRL